jgi:vacuolar-type H+-ATPase catalytic subunit A/Vma1
MHKEIKKGIFISEYQIDVLKKYDIDAFSCSSINEILFLIDEILDEVDEDDLYMVYNELNEFNYYSNVNK